MRSPTSRQRGSRLDLPMTPMIDVVFLLIIFFLCTASFQATEEVLPTSLSLPGSVDAKVKAEPELEDLDEVVVKLSWEDGRPRWEINNRAYGRLEEVGGVLGAIVRRVQEDLPVILDVEGRVPMENVIDLYDLCRRVGLERIRFAASGGLG